MSRSSDLQERIAEALRRRRVEDLTARLAAQLGMLAFTVVFEPWLQSGVDQEFPPLTPGPWAAYADGWRNS